MRPLAAGWARFLAAPQPGALANVSTRVPTPRGDVEAAFSQGGGGVALALSVPQGAAAQVCLPPLHGAAGGAGGAGDALLVDGAAAPAVPWGRLLCAVGDLPPGAHTIERVQKAKGSARIK